MIQFITLWLMSLILPPQHPSPIVTGIFPPGASVGTSESWKISGRNLARVDSIVVDGGEGLGFGPISADVSGQSAVVEVRVDRAAAPGFRQVRVDGPDGISNLAIIRVDPLPQRSEVEPNDDVTAASQTIAVGTAVAGTIRPLDVDRFRVEGQPGRKVTLDWETRRLGTSITPLMTITGPNRSAITQIRSGRGGDRDCRSSVVIPPEGWFEVELRDNIYGGDDRARYRLRVDPAPFASGMFPLGGPPDKVVVSTIQGGSLASPVEKSTTMPTIAGAWSDPGAFLEPRSGLAILCPDRMRVGDGISPEIFEPIDPFPGEVVPVSPGPTGLVINGQIRRPGEVDRYRVQARTGDRLRLRVEAAVCGSWLDSVLIVRDARGEFLGESDDLKPTSTIEPPSTIDGSASTDSKVDLNVPSDGPITVELADRFDSGGPEFAYRLELGPPVDDFGLFLVASPTTADPGIDARSLANPDAVSASPPSPGRFGAFNLEPGTTTPVHFLVVPQGRPGSIEVRAEGLPAGVTSEPVLVRLASAPRAKSKTEVAFDSPPVLDSLRLRVAADASPIRGTFRVVARRRVSAGNNTRAVEHEASMVVGVDAAGGPGRPTIHSSSSFPIRVRGMPRS